MPPPVRTPPWRRDLVRSAAAVGASYLIGSLPLDFLAARRLAGADLREVGDGTVSGTGLYEVTGFGTLAMVGCAELAQGAIAGRLGHESSAVGAIAAGAAIAGHNWSPFIGFSGGRGISVALGALLARAPEGAAILAVGLGGGRLCRQSGVGCAVAIFALTPALALTRGRPGLWTGLAVALPIVAKRLAGNQPAAAPRWHAYWSRLVFDRDRGSRPKSPAETPH